MNEADARGALQRAFGGLEGSGSETSLRWIELIHRQLRGELRFLELERRELGVLVKRPEGGLQTAPWKRDTRTVGGNDAVPDVTIRFRLVDVRTGETVFEGWSGDVAT